MSVLQFPPPRRRGLLFHGFVILALITLIILSIWNISRFNVGTIFILNLLLMLAAFTLLPLMGYRAYSVIQGNYTLDRERITIQWGLRYEDLPLSDIEWVRSALDLTTPLPLPRFRLPGSVLGFRRHPDLGVVEFLASETRNLLLIATAKRVFAISPADPIIFVREFQRFIELGSLTSMPARSIYPSFIIARAYDSALARYLWLSGLFLNIGLIIWVSLLTPNLTRVPLGFSPYGEPLGPFPPLRLLLLPLLSASSFVVGWLAGLFFYRQPQQQIIAFIIWASSSLTSLLFLLAVLFTITTPI